MPRSVESAIVPQQLEAEALAQFSKHRWPAEGPVRELLEYLDALHKDAGQPSLAEMGHAVALAPSTLSAFFSGVRLVSRGNLALLVRHLGGDGETAERLRRKAATFWNAERSGSIPSSRMQVPGAGDPCETDDDFAGPTDRTAASETATRLDLMVFHAPVNQLNRPSRLVGRQHLVDTVNTLLDQGQRVLLYGLAGSGKSALAATVADQRTEAGRGSYLWLRNGLWDEEVIIDGLARRLASPAERDRITAATGDARWMALHDVIGRSGVGLVVVDDVWHPPVLYDLVRAVPHHIGMVITSRLKLALHNCIEVAGLAPAEAATLLALHAREDALAEHPDADALCKDLGYHPFAIEIAGQYLWQYAATPGELRGQISGAPHHLTMPAGFAHAGRESLEVLLDQSYRALTNEDSRSALAAFGAFTAASVTAELLAAYLRLPVPRTRAALNALVDVSLAKRVAGNVSYQVHDLTYSYARALFELAAPDHPAAVEAVRQFLTAHAQDYDLLDDELENVLSAAAQARDDDPEAFVAIVEMVATGGYLDDHGHTLGLLRLLDEAIEMVSGWGGQHRTRLHHLVTKRGNAHYNRGELTAAVASYRAALELAPTPHRLAIVLGVRAKVLAELGDHKAAEADFARAYAICEESADEHGTLRLLEQHSVAAFRQQNYQRVRELTLRGVALSRRLGARNVEAIFLNNLGTAEFELGVCAAIERHREAQALATELHDDDTVALTHRTLGADYHAQEKYEQAREHFTRALGLYHKLGQVDRETRLRHMMRQFGYLTDHSMEGAGP